MFESLERQPPDALLQLIKLYAADARPKKIDLGVGVYRTEDGATPVFKAVKLAETELAQKQDSKAYLGPEGDLGFCDGLKPYIFGDALRNRPMARVQTPGGTGALRLAMDVLAKAGAKRLLLGAPSWPNHGPIAKAAGLEIIGYTHADIATQTLDFDSLVAAMQGAEEGDIVLLHGCCHNPTGIDYSPEQWDRIVEIVIAKKLFPLIDFAYQALGIGFEEDAAGARKLIAAAPQAVLAYSCDKNFGLYRDRVGAVYVLAEDDRIEVINSNMLALARANWSMPPDHGAVAVRTVLENAEYTQVWLDELTAMRGRINGVRDTLASYQRIGNVDLAAVGAQNGLFSTLNLSKEQIARMREEYGIYMAGSGRINVAGFTQANIPHFIEALRAVSA